MRMGLQRTSTGQALKPPIGRAPEPRPIATLDRSCYTTLTDRTPKPRLIATLDRSCYITPTGRALQRRKGEENKYLKVVHIIGEYRVVYNMLSNSPEYFLYYLFLYSLVILLCFHLEFVSSCCCYLHAKGWKGHEQGTPTDSPIGLKDRRTGDG